MILFPHQGVRLATSHPLSWGETNVLVKYPPPQVYERPHLMSHSNTIVLVSCQCRKLLSVAIETAHCPWRHVMLFSHLSSRNIPGICIFPAKCHSQTLNHCPQPFPQGFLQFAIKDSQPTSCFFCTRTS
ncbi:hypothetical protein XELAEV_18001025mg [Xenopus laevis]|nr:hypothetical protein XELAEV_18001025mg [Xenopus laevis]